MSDARPMRRNPGPSWGYGFLLWAERWWPRWVFRPALMAGTWIGFWGMPEQRRHSREFLAIVRGRRPTVREEWRHFFAFAEFLMRKLRAGRGIEVKCVLLPEHAAEFTTLARSAQPALFGTFHFGCSDLLGYLLGEFGRTVSIVRLRVDNSDDTRLLGARFGARTSFLWVNDPANLLFELKATLEGGGSLALKCDRLEFSARAEPFEFLGARRLFPFTIYHLAVLFDRPVVFCFARPGSDEDAIEVQASPVFRPQPGAGREANLQAARGHFQGVLAALEAAVRREPELWFNFLPLNPAVADGAEGRA